jgi:hypothetical protein
VRYPFAKRGAPVYIGEKVKLSDKGDLWPW